MFSEIFYSINLLIFGIMLSALVAGTSYIFGDKHPDQEKVSTYECGFDPLGNPGKPFSIHFFLIGILFLIFDIEISFILPWCIAYNQTFPFSYWVMVLFLTVLTVGLVYEWLQGGLE